jgi:hypothetical protein
MLVIARVVKGRVYSWYTWEYLREATSEDEMAWNSKEGSTITVEFPPDELKKQAPQAYDLTVKGILGHEEIAFDVEKFLDRVEGNMSTEDALKKYKEYNLGGFLCTREGLKTLQKLTFLRKLSATRLGESLTRLD